MKQLMHKWLLLLFCILVSSQLQAQYNLRSVEYNRIGWYNTFARLQLKAGWSLHTEYQWRRTDWISSWQQSLLRTGINYQIHPKVQLRIGYGWIETFAYGKTPLNVYGKTFTEHRIFQAVSINDKIGRLELLHRFKLEQRWTGIYDNPGAEQEDRYVYLNRVRYLLRLQLPISPHLGNKFAYIGAYDELFVGFGKQLGENIFDQNRLALLLGYQLSHSFKLEAGAFNQILMLARREDNKTVLQNNTGLVVNAFFNLKLLTE